MQVNFDKIVERRNTDAMKWDECKSEFGTEDILPMWVADMDFMTAEPVIEAIKKRAAHGIFGYASPSNMYYDAICSWMKKRYDSVIDREWIRFSPGVVPALNFLIQALTKPHDKIVIQPPVYYPFFNAVRNNDRQLVLNPLKCENGYYTMDYEDLERKIDADTKMLILCSPHNPVGRVWKKEELEALGDVCLRHHLIIIADEIHADLLFAGYKHTSFFTVAERFIQNTIVCTAPSKTFNLAGLQMSSILIPNRDYREAYAKQLLRCNILRPNVFGLTAIEAAYQHGEEWLEQLLPYLQGNLDFLMEYFEKYIPRIKVHKPEGTYLIWLDCRDLHMDTEELESFMIKTAKVGMDSGRWFGDEGVSFMRINIACPRATLKEGLRRIHFAVDKL